MDNILGGDKLFTGTDQADADGINKKATIGSELLKSVERSYEEEKRHADDFDDLQSPLKSSKIDVGDSERRSDALLSEERYYREQVEARQHQPPMNSCEDDLETILETDQESNFMTTNRTMMQHGPHGPFNPDANNKTMTGVSSHGDNMLIARERSENEQSEALLLKSQHHSAEKSINNMSISIADNQELPQ